MTLVDRLVATIASTEEVDRTKLLLVGSPAAVEILKAEPGARSLWQDRGEFEIAHKTIVGRFAFVPVSAAQLPTLAERAFVLVRPKGPEICLVVAGW